MNKIHRIKINQMNSTESNYNLINFLLGGNLHQITQSHFDSRI